MKTKHYIITWSFLLVGLLYNGKLWAQAQGTSTSFEMAEDIGTYSESFQQGPLTRNTKPDYHYPIFVQDEQNYVLYDENSEEPIRDFLGAGPAMFFKLKLDTPFRVNVRTDNIPQMMNGVYMHIAVYRKKKFYVVYSCLGKGFSSLDEVMEYDYTLLYNGGLNIDVNMDMHPDEYYIILAGMGVRPGSVNYGYMHVYFSGEPIPEDEQDSANYLPSFDPNVVPVKPEGFENVSAIDDLEVETRAELRLTETRPYIYSRTYTRTDSSEYFENIQYYDGLGRLKQKVERDAAPTYKDLITTYDYDARDRILREWLPVRVGGNNEGSYVSDYKDESYSYYQDSAYLSIDYKNLYLDRETTIAAPGSTYKDWEIYSENNYLFNKGKTGDLACLNFKASNQKETSIQLIGYYGDGQLYVSQNINEDSHIVYSFTDKTGKLLLTRQLNEGKLHDTYYIYDDFGNLRAVLPPIAIDKIGSNPSQLLRSSSTMKNYAYMYIYDDYNRCIAKKLPGCDWIYYIYDRADQLIFTQDGEQREKNEWSYSIPDLLGRTILTGVCTHIFNYEANPLGNSLVRAERPVTGNGTHMGYNITGINFETKDIYSVNYYDDYDFLISLDTNFKNHLSYEEKPEYGKLYIDPVLNRKTPVGLLTGVRTKHLGENNSTSTETVTTFWYDDRARPVQTRSTNHLGGIDCEYIAYNYIGQPLKSLYIHTANDSPVQTEKYNYTYDHAGRLLTTTHQWNDGAVTMLAENTYDEVGRLETNQKGDNENLKTLFDYNVRSWTSAIRNNLFSEDLNYSYLGNIYHMQWQQSGQTYNYKFMYDHLSRLLSATYIPPVIEGRSYSSAYSSAYGVSIPNQGDALQRDYSTSYSYDKHGNISSLKRYGKLSDSPVSYGLLDNWSMGYTGNQLSAIAESIPIASGLDLKKDSEIATPFTQYSYNKNGALVKNSRTGITNIQYNSLNLPRQIDIKNSVAEARNEYLYSADGRKLQVIQRWNPDFDVTSGIVGSIDKNLLSEEKVTDYIGNKIYENGELKKVLLTGGYYDVEKGEYFFYLTDLLGNNRIVADQNGQVIQENQYYPFGMEFADGRSKEVQPYKYNGKELDSMHGLNLYDYSARYYEPSIGRFTTMDPSAEKYYSLSPYVYGFNNPIRYIDPDGADGWDSLIGGGIGLLTNVIPGTSFLRDKYTPRSSEDYNNALRRVDNATTAASILMVTGGGGMATGGGAMAGAGLVVTSTVVGAPEGLALTGSGIVVIGAAEATIAGGLYLMANTANNASEGYNRGKKDTRTAKDNLRVDKHGNKIPDSEAVGAAHTQLGTRKGKYKQAREFDANGNEIRDIDFTDHKRPDHPNPHQHVYRDNSTGGTRERGGPEPLWKFD